MKFVYWGINREVYAHDVSWQNGLEVLTGQRFSGVMLSQGAVSGSAKKIQKDTNGLMRSLLDELRTYFEAKCP